ncbi:MAG: hypothetical protein A2033_00235 [Bacteroidetes bacterium GWA2_31_9]|nr:MAG: hypothetical protein A2033_00235 [Bacteroidetes bacterium GWA2_31_9]
MEKEFNPFIVSGYKGQQYFCDREFESSILKKNLENNINTTLFAIRRIGKTGLIHYVFDSYKNNSKIKCIYVDILSSYNLKDFTNLLATVIYNNFQEDNSIGKKIINAIKSLSPIISFDNLTGNPELSFKLNDTKQYESTIYQLFSFLESQNKKIFVAIDEFQQILEYAEKNTEALLRTYIQTLKNTQFIFCGSNQKMMHEIFNNAKRPFFASCSNLHLDYIKTEKYFEFINQIFSQNKRKINKQSIDFIIEFTGCHTFYTQFFCNYLYSSGIKNIDFTDVQNIALEILKLNENTFFQYRNLLTSAQWQLLQAISKEEKLYKAHSKLFINKYKLGTSSMISRGIEALLEKELIFYNTSVENPYYETYDKFLMRWMQYK